MARPKKRKSKRKTKTRNAKKKSVARRKTKAKRSVKRRAPRRSEADMSPRELRLSRRRRSSQREGRIERDFQRAVNMTPAALSKWLKSKESRKVSGRAGGASPSGGHWAGLRVMEIKKKTPGDRTPQDYSHMRKVIAYVSRHGARRPNGDVRNSPWRHSLMNWGHDPLK